jgi:hypothetical protein
VPHVVINHPVAENEGQTVLQSMPEKTLTVPLMNPNMLLTNMLTTT